MKYIIQSVVDSPTSTGKQRKIVSVQNEQGAMYAGVGVWSDFPQFSTLAVGMTVEGDVKTNGKYTTLYAIRASGGFVGASRPNPSAMVAEKAKNIEVAQTRKETGIEIASTFRAATDFVINSLDFKEMDMAEKKKAWTTWRKWFSENWDNVSGEISSVDEIPF